MKDVRAILELCNCGYRLVNWSGSICEVQERLGEKMEKRRARGALQAKVKHKKGSNIIYNLKANLFDFKGHKRCDYEAIFAQYGHLRVATRSN